MSLETPDFHFVGSERKSKQSEREQRAIKTVGSAIIVVDRKPKHINANRRGTRDEQQHSCCKRVILIDDDDFVAD